MSDDMSEFEGG